MTLENLPDGATAGNPARRNSPTQFSTSDAPPAAANRALRRQWAAEANAALRRTGDPDLARHAAARMIVAALDMDARLARARVGDDRRDLPADSIALPRTIERRARNDDGALDEAARRVAAGVWP